MTNGTYTTEPRREPRTYTMSGAASSGPSAVSWGAIFAGAAAAAALSLVLLILGTGLGLSSLSPWANEGPRAETLGVSTILWVTFMQLASAALGGYIAGRLRTKWVDLHNDEVAFRDTAHGFLAWAVATLLTAALLTSTVSMLLGAGVRAGAEVAGGAASAATAAAAGGAAAGGEQGSQSGGDGGPMGYFVDSLFRSAKPAARGAQGGGSEQGGTQEVTRIFANALTEGKLPEQDARYVGQLVAQRTGLSPQEAQKRVSEAFGQMQAKKQEAETKAREAADQARKASAMAALWLFIALLIGAFVASYSATAGGRHRDD